MHSMYPHRLALSTCPQVGKILKIVQRQNGSHTLSVTWYYRPEEVWGGRKVRGGHERLIAGTGAIARRSNYNALVARSV